MKQGRYGIVKLNIQLELSDFYDNLNIFKQRKLTISENQEEFDLLKLCYIRNKDGWSCGV